MGSTRTSSASLVSKLSSEHGAAHIRFINVSEILQLPPSSGAQNSHYCSLSIFLLICAFVFRPTVFNSQLYLPTWRRQLHLLVSDPPAGSRPCLPETVPFRKLADCQKGGLNLVTYLEEGGSKASSML